MADKVKELEERLDRLESRLKTTFLEVERRFESLRVEEPAIVSVEERLQEMEDLILLVQLEITKIKEKTGGEEFISIAGQPDVDERIKKIEELLASPAQPATIGAIGAAQKPPASRIMEGKLERLERKLEDLTESSPSGSAALDELERRLERLESHSRRPAEHTERYVAVSSSGLQQEIKRILEA